MKRVLLLTLAVIVLFKLYKQIGKIIDVLSGNDSDLYVVGFIFGVFIPYFLILLLVKPKTFTNP